MTLGQFSQVVLLPQGQFDTFLRASSDDRHKVLTQLFRTRRFEDVERWLAERRTTLRRAGERHHDTVAGLLHRVSEATGADLPSAWDVADLSEPAGAGDIAAWTASLAAHADEQVTSSATTLDAAARALASATEAHDAGRRLRELRQRHATALAAHRALADTAGQAEADRRAPGPGPPGRDGGAARPGRRALGRRPRARPRRREPTPFAGWRRCWRSSRTASTPAWLAERARHATETRRCRPQLPPPRPRARRDHDPPDRRRAAPAADSPPSTTGSAHLPLPCPGRQAALTVLLETQRAQAEPLQECRAELAELARRVAFVATIEELEWQVGKSAELLDERRQETMRLKDQLIDLREARLSGMAAELAAAIAVGQDCPVCGSHDHPRLASPATGAPTKADEQSLRRRVDDAEVAQEMVADQSAVSRPGSRPPARSPVTPRRSRCGPRAMPPGCGSPPPRRALPRSPGSSPS